MVQALGIGANEVVDALLRICEGYKGAELS